MFKTKLFYRYPEFIYKYLSFDANKYYEDILMHDTMYFTSPIYFNDPFDCDINMIYKVKSKRFIKKHVLSVLESGLSDINGYQEKLAKEFINKNFYDFNPGRQEVQQNLHQNLRDFIRRSGVYCMSSINDNILMWSHYALYHTGFCIEFNCQKLVDTLVQHNKTNGAITYLDKVKYKSLYPALSGYKDDNFVQSLFIKSTNWKYEKEWRVVYSEGSRMKIKLPGNVITGVYMGLKMENGKMDLIKEAASAKNYKIDLYKAHQNDKQFSISFRSIET